MERAQQAADFGSVAEDDGQPRVLATLFGQELFTDIGDVGLLAAEDEKLPRFDLGAFLIGFEGARFPHARFNFFLHPLEKRMRRMETVPAR